MEKGKLSQIDDILKFLKFNDNPVIPDSSEFNDTFKSIFGYSLTDSYFWLKQDLCDKYNLIIVQEFSEKNLFSYCVISLTKEGDKACEMGIHKYLEDLAYKEKLDIEAKKSSKISATRANTSIIIAVIAIIITIIIAGFSLNDTIFNKIFNNKYNNKHNNKNNTDYPQDKSVQIKDTTLSNKFVGTPSSTVIISDTIDNIKHNNNF